MNQTLSVLVSGCVLVFFLALAASWEFCRDFLLDVLPALLLSVCLLSLAVFLSAFWSGAPMAGDSNPHRERLLP